MAQRTRFVQDGNTVLVYYDYGDGEQTKKFEYRDDGYIYDGEKKINGYPLALDKPRELVKLVRANWYGR